MSKSIKIRTNTDKAKSMLFNAIVATRKATKKAVKHSKKAATTANSTRKEFTSIAKQAWNSDIS